MVVRKITINSLFEGIYGCELVFYISICFFENYILNLFYHFTKAK